MNALEVRGLCKAYPGFRLEDVSFSVPEGAVVGMVGATARGSPRRSSPCWASSGPTRGRSGFSAGDLLREGPACGSRSAWPSARPASIRKRS